MCKFRRRAVVCALFALFPAGLPRIMQGQTARSELTLREGWAIQSNCKISATGDQISTVGFDTKGWHRGTVPTTVLAALVADATYPDPYPGKNLLSIPGEAYSADENFVLQQMPADSPFRCSWWYRTEFQLPPLTQQRYSTLHFEGINNRANIWLNGKKIAGVADVAGSDRTYDFNVTDEIRASGKNALAVEVFAQTPDDFGINWVDWNPAPPDKDMGLWREVYVDTSGPVAIRDPFVTTHFSSGSLDPAELTVETQLRNLSAAAISGTLTGEIEGLTFQQNVSLSANESRAVRFTPEEFPQLRVRNPKLWWPAQMGNPALHNLQLRFVVAGGSVSDQQTVRFGIREIASSIDAHGNRLLSINGKKIFIRGAGWAPDMMLRESPDRLRTEFRYIRDLNLNTIRLEGKLETQAFYDLADERGILIMPGWSCCDLWQDGPQWSPAQLQIAVASLQSQAMRLRSHPSVLVWLNGSDAGPPPNVESAFLDVLKKADWPNPILFSAADETSTITGPTGVKMTGPYNYAPPDFWLADKGSNGGAAGFNMETSPGPAIPPKSSLEKMLGAAHLQLGDPAWTFHTAEGDYSKLDDFNGAMTAIYGPPTDLNDYERKAQAMAYDAERAMFEAYTRNKYSSTTGIIQWMLNNAWPSLYWHLYDYYLQPAGGYFGAKKALEPLHVQYSYDDQSVIVVNSTYVPSSAMRVVATVYDPSMRQLYSTTAPAQVPADSTAKVVTIPPAILENDSEVHFLALELLRTDGRAISNNFYWLPAKADVFDWANASWKFTPVAVYSDLKALSTLPTVHLSANCSAKLDQKEPLISVRLTNPTKSLAFRIHVAIRRKSTDSEILPVTWSDNDIDLLPGEPRELTARLLSAPALDAPSEISITGWNISQLTIPITRPK